MSSRPSWLRVKAKPDHNYHQMTAVFKKSRLSTVCESSACPNIWECFSRREATFLILGSICTRACGYCRIISGGPGKVDLSEPKRLAEAVQVLGLNNVVITSVTRDDLQDGGAGAFARTVRAVRGVSPSCFIELLIPDFAGNWAALEQVMEAGPDIIGHNIETVPRLHPELKPQSDYRLSMSLLRRSVMSGKKVKSGLMVGLGEARREIRQAIEDLAEAGVKSITIGQYLQPSDKQYPVARYYKPVEFMGLAAYAQRLGFRRIISGPMVRSSYRGQLSGFTENRCSNL